MLKSMPSEPRVIGRLEVAEGPLYSRMPPLNVSEPLGRLAVLSTRKRAPSTLKVAEFELLVSKSVPPPVRRNDPGAREKPLVQVTPGFTTRSMLAPVSLVRREPAGTPLPVQ